jgi:hypothetical protein
MANETTGKTVLVQGRIVWTSGDLFKGKIKTEFNTQIPKVNPKTGEQMKEYGFGLAVPKSALSAVGPGQPGHIWAAVHEEAYTLYPSRNLPPGFAMKYKDGDGIDDKGVPFAQREGYAGHIIFACTTSIPIKFFKYENNQNIQINEGIKCGDYVNVQLTVKAHGAQGQGKPGLYLNPNAVQFLGFGTEIVNAPSGDQLFGTQAPPLPPGASATPIAPQGMIVPQGLPPTTMAQQQYAPPPQPVQQAQPYHAVLPPQFQPAPQQVYQPPPQQFQQPAPPPPQQYQQPQMAQPVPGPAGFPVPGR